MRSSYDLSQLITSWTSTSHSTRQMASSTAVSRGRAQSTTTGTLPIYLSRISSISSEAHPARSSVRNSTGLFNRATRESSSPTPSTRPSVIEVGSSKSTVLTKHNFLFSSLFSYTPHFLIDLSYSRNHCLDLPGCYWYPSGPLLQTDVAQSCSLPLPCLVLGNDSLS